MDFKKTFEEYNKYYAEFFIYDSEESIVRTDEELLKDRSLFSMYDTPFVDDYCETFGLDLDACNDIKRYCWLKKIQEVFENEHQEYINNEIYFSGCSFKVYQKTYSSRLKEFKDKFIDADEIDFIKKEYIFEDENIIIPVYETLPIIFTDDYYKNKKYSENKRQHFLATKIDELGYEINCYDEEIFTYHDHRTTTVTKCSIVKKVVSNITEADTKNINPVSWTGERTELMELIKALIENGSVKGKLKDIIENFCKFFNIEIKYPNKLINDFKNTRNNGSETLFIDNLKSSLLGFINKEKRR